MSGWSGPTATTDRRAGAAFATRACFGYEGKTDP